MKYILILGLLFVLSMMACGDKGIDEHNRIIKVEERKIELNPKDSLVYWTYGGPPEPYYTYAEKMFSKKYGVEYRKEGCVVNDSIFLFMITNNDSLFKRLSKKYPGMDELKMNLTLQDYVTLHKTLEGIALRTSLMEHKRKEVGSDNYFYTEWQYIKGSDSTYTLDVNITGRKPDELIYTFKINPSNADILLKNQEGQWVEW